MTTYKSLNAEQLYRSCVLDQVEFANTDELDTLDEPIGQKRAMEAIEFGIDIKQEGFNLFVVGPTGLGKHHLVKQILNQRAEVETQQYDWCYVNNFDNPQSPKVLKLPAGFGCQLSRDMDQFLEDLLTALPATLQDEDFRSRLQEIEEEFQARNKQSFTQLDQEAREKGAMLVRTPSGYSIAPVADNGVLSREDFEKLDKAEQQKIEEITVEFQENLQDLIRDMPLMKRELAQKIKALYKEVTTVVVEQIIAWVEHRYDQHPDVVDYLHDVKTHAVDHVEEYLPEGDLVEIEQNKQIAKGFHIFKVNVIVDNSGLTGAPMVFEDNPTYQNLIGRVEYVSEMGNVLTDFTLIKGGALHRANGGYLILDSRKLLTNLYAWEGLKRALKSGRLKISSMQEEFGLVSMQSLEPESISVNTKIVLTGEPQLYYLLKQYDPEFSQLFKVCADFSMHADSSDKNNLLYARMIATLQRRANLKPLNKRAVERIIEQASRFAEDSEKLSLHLESINDLLHEADHWASKADSSIIRVEDIEKAIAKKHYRHNQIGDHMQEQILRGIKLIDSEGSKIGQVNGLSVMQVGDLMFGKPSRISATARLGTGKVIDIERESELGGEIHSKGMMILSAYLANHYARNQPLALTASIVFEQSYGYIDGDSASAAELCVLMSAIANIPLKQCLAVTGSINQFGEIQAIGGINQKIEGFFDVCNQRALTGDQGVIFPAANQVHLMLSREVRDAVSAGMFHIYTVEHVEDVMEILSGLERGESDEDGCYPDGSFNQIMLNRIHELQCLQNQFSQKSITAGNGGTMHGGDND